MYKSKFSSRQEAYDYTVHLLKTSKNKPAVVRNYAKVISKMATPKPTIQMAKSKEVVIYQAFKYTTGKVPTNVLNINTDGVIDI